MSLLFNKRLGLVLDRKSLQEYPVNDVVLRGSILALMVFLPYINDLTDDVICDVVIYADDTTLYSKYDKASHFLAATRIGFRT